MIFEENAPEIFFQTKSSERAKQNGKSYNRKGHS